MSDQNQQGSQKSTLCCSFCGKSQYEVQKLIAGQSVFICDECTDLCTDILNNEMGYARFTTLAGLCDVAMQRWAFEPTKLEGLEKAVADGDVSFVMRQTRRELKKRARAIGRCARAGTRREEGIEQLILTIITVLQCARLVGIGADELSQGVKAWAVNRSKQ